MKRRRRDGAKTCLFANDDVTSKVGYRLAGASRCFATVNAGRQGRGSVLFTGACGIFCSVQAKTIPSAAEEGEESKGGDTVRRFFFSFSFPCAKPTIGQATSFSTLPFTSLLCSLSVSLSRRGRETRQSYGRTSGSPSISHTLTETAAHRLRVRDIRHYQQTVEHAGDGIAFVMPHRTEAEMLLPR